MSRDCYEAIPLSAMGLSAVCDCDTHYFWTAMALATFAWSSLSLRHSLKFSCGECHFVRAAKDLASLHICTGLP